MRFGLDNNGNRISPSRTGERATCDMCKGTLIAHYGKFRQHWQHEDKQDCDSWKGPETAWHLNWKSNFPKNWQEVVLTEDEEKHRADVKTKDSLVIEFQNSFISYSEIQEREKFYGNMIWVINAEEFKSSFEIYSVVTSKLRKADADAHFDEISFTNSYLEKLEYFEEAITKNRDSGIYKRQQIKENHEKTNKFKQQLSSFDSFSKKIINTWSSGNFLEMGDQYEITYEINHEYKKKLEKKSNQLVENKNKIDANEQKLQYIESLKNYDIEERTYKIVDYSQISPENFKKVKVIQKGSKNNLFSKIKSINTKTEFKNYSYKKDNFVFIIDLSEIISNLKKKNKHLEDKLISLKNSFQLLKTEIKDNLEKSLRSKIEGLEKELEKLKIEWERFISKKDDLIQKKAIHKQSKDKKLYEAKKEIKRNKEKKRSKIMRKKKGLYTFIWKHRRKSWEAANCPIYFDFGKGILFKKLEDNLLKKIKHKEFLSKFNS